MTARGERLGRPGGHPRHGRIKPRIAISSSSFSKSSLNWASASSIASKDFFTAAGKSSASMFCYFSSSRAIVAPQQKRRRAYQRTEGLFLLTGAARVMRARGSGGQSGYRRARDLAQLLDDSDAALALILQNSFDLSIFKAGKVTLLTFRAKRREIAARLRQ
jgi:hypothetical protein